MIDERNTSSENMAPTQRGQQSNPDKRVYTVDEIQNILGIGRTSAYSLVKQRVFHSVRVGGSIRISKKSFDAWLDSQI